jgi:hypothetical protein
LGVLVYEEEEFHYSRMAACCLDCMANSGSLQEEDLGYMGWLGHLVEYRENGSVASMEGEISCRDSDLDLGFPECTGLE